MFISGLEAGGRDPLLRQVLMLDPVFKKYDQTERLSAIQNTPGGRKLHTPLYWSLSVTQKHTHTQTLEWKFKLTVNISNKYIPPSFCFKILK